MVYECEIHGSRGAAVAAPEHYIPLIYSHLLTMANSYAGEIWVEVLRE